MHNFEWVTDYSLKYIFQKDSEPWGYEGLCMNFLFDPQQLPHVQSNKGVIEILYR